MSWAWCHDLEKLPRVCDVMSPKVEDHRFLALQIVGYRWQMAQNASPSGKADLMDKLHGSKGVMLVWERQQPMCLGSWQYGTLTDWDSLYSHKLLSQGATGYFQELSVLLAPLHHSSLFLRNIFNMTLGCGQAWRTSIVREHWCKWELLVPSPSPRRSEVYTEKSEFAIYSLS